MRLNKKKENRQLSAGFVVLENPFSLNLVAYQEEQGIYNCLQYGLAKVACVEEPGEEGYQSGGGCKLDDAKDVVADQGALSTGAEYLLAV